MQWKSGSQSYDTTRQHTSVDDPSDTIIGLTNGTAYTVRVFVRNATGEGAASAEASATPVLTLTASAVEADTATLTRDERTATTTPALLWHYKYTVPATPEGTCSTAVAAGVATADLTGLVPGTSHTFKAYSDAGCTAEVTGDASDADFLTKPGQVTGVTVASGDTPGDPSLAVGWTAPSGTVTGYRVQWKSGEESFDATRQITVTTGTAASITGLAAATTYTVRVTAYNATGDGAASVEASAAPTVNVPAPPTGLTVSEGDASVTLSWTAGSDGGAAVTRWEVRRKVGSGEYGAWAAIPDSGAGTRRHTVTKLANGAVYRFKVRAVNGVGDGAASAESAAATPSVLCGRTPAVRDAIVAAVSGKSTCGAVTTTDLAGLTGKLNLKDKSVAGLKSGDFAGLGGLTQLDLSGNDLGALPAGVFDPLAALTSLTLASNDLTGVPAGAFDRLTALTSLDLGTNRLASLPAGVFDRLTALTSLDLGTNRLASLPAGLFDRATALATLHLDTNQLATLSPGVFDALTALTTLDTFGNPLTCLPFIPASVTGGKRHATTADSAFPACGAGLTASASAVSVGAGASETFTLVLAASPNRFAASGNVTVTLASGDTTKATVSPATLTFGTGNWSTPQTVTVTGVAAGSVTLGIGVAGGGYGAVTAPSVTATVTTASLEASAVTDTTATLTLSGHAGTWYHILTTPGGATTCFEMSGTTLSLTRLDAGARYTSKAYSDATCATEIAAESFDTLDLTASGATATGMKLALANHAGSWYWKHATGTCSTTAVSGGATASVADLAAGTGYTFSAYSDGTCTTGNRLATAAAHATLPPAPGKPTVSVAGQASGAVRIGAVLGGGAAPVVRWEYTKKAGSGGYDPAWTEIAGTLKTLIHTVTGLTAGTAYRIKVRAVNASGAGAESAESDAVTPRAETLAASAVQATTATLTLSGHAGTWYYKRTEPSGDDTCTAAPGTTVSLSTLDPGTSYTYRAYSDSTCAAANELASETFLTRPGQVAGVTVTAGSESVNVGWTAATGAAGYRVQWKSGNEAWSATRETTATTNAKAVTGLTNGAAYTLRVAATNATGDGAWSAEATGTPRRARRP